GGDDRHRRGRRRGGRRRRRGVASGGRPAPPFRRADDPDRAANRLAPARPLVHPSSVPSPGEIWFPLVDEPIGGIVREIQEEHPEIAALVDSPRRLLAFRTFAYIRVGILLGRLLV